MTKHWQGKKFSDEHRRRIGESRKGIRCSIATEFKKGMTPHNFKGRVSDSYGYVLLFMPQHPMANSSGYVREHRFIMESSIGRTLSKDEIVHHKNGIRDDNRIDNLELFANHKDHLAKCHKEFSRNPLNTNTHRQCGMCKNVLPLSPLFFCASKRSKMGISYVCRDCNREVSAKRRERIKG